MELCCEVQCYAWGKVGGDSQVAKYAPRACQDFNLDPDQTYAELWMGTHANGPSKIVENNKLLSEYISDHPECVGDKIRNKFGPELPFLFKVLSVNKALSIQAHPNKSHAEQLHAERPNIYKDPNHKPEIAIALTKFEGLCGFRPLHEIQNFFYRTPELKTVCSEYEQLLSSTDSNYQEGLKACFESLMLCDKNLLEQELESLRKKMMRNESQDDVSELFLRLCSQYPGDVGCFVIFFLNLLKLSPGEAMFLSPNVPHAYLSGDCVEVMANSDNVVRAGLTPKLIDTPTLISMLDYTCTPPDQRLFTPTQSSQHCQVFNPPVPDFSVARLKNISFDKIFQS